MRKRFAIYILAAVSLEQLTIAQTVHRLAFASTGNIIELAVVNNSSAATYQVKIEALNTPSWLHFNSTEQRVAALESGKESTAFFTFAVDESAPVNQEQTLRFAISVNTGEQWTKEIKIVIRPPDQLQLFQNYPNPFNPTTTIAYQLPEDGLVSLQVFNVLGQVVASLVEGDRSAGYHQVEWSAEREASGLYLYRLIVTGRAGNRQISKRAMMLVK